MNESPNDSPGTTGRPHTHPGLLIGPGAWWYSATPIASLPSAGWSVR